MYRITRESLFKFLEELRKDNKLIAPVRLEQDIEFSYVNDINDIAFDFGNTVKPAKDFFIPQNEEILKFDGIITANLRDEKRVFFGIRPCDLSGLLVMDETFNEQTKDPHYLSKRNNTIIMAFACTKNCDENAFCDSVYGHTAKEGFDLQIFKNNDGFIVETGSTKGAELVNEHNKLFKEAGSEADLDVNKIKEEKINQKEVDMNLFYKKLDKDKFDDVIYWKETSLTCLRCGACNYLCPSCFCNNMIDSQKGRARCWDSCILRGFTKEAAGYIPRNELYTRFRQRVFHKYRWHKQRYGMHMCTGCGRCVTFCPGSIDYIKIINENEK